MLQTIAEQAVLVQAFPCTLTICLHMLQKPLQAGEHISGLQHTSLLQTHLQGLEVLLLPVACPAPLLEGWPTRPNYVPVGITAAGELVAALPPNPFMAEGYEDIIAY